MKKLILLVLIPVAFVGCFGCSEDARWHDLPMLIQDTHCQSQKISNIVPSDDLIIVKCFPSDQLAKIVDDYNSAIGFEAVKIVNNAPVRIEMAPKEEMVEDKDGVATWNASGGIIKSGTIKILQVQMNPEAMEVIMAHELTHMLGHFQHAPFGLMESKINIKSSLDKLISDGDIKEWFEEKYPEVIESHSIQN